jgi:hypothetical protein
VGHGLDYGSWFKGCVLPDGPTARGAITS